MLLERRTMLFSCPEEYRKFEELRPGDMFCWASDVKPDNGYSYGPPRDRYVITKNTNRHPGTHVYLVISTYTTTDVFAYGDERLLNIHVWCYNTMSRCTFTATMNSTNTDVFVLLSPD